LSQSSHPGSANPEQSAGNRSNRASLSGEPAGTRAQGRTARVDIRRPAGNRVMIHNRSRHFVAFNGRPSSRTTIIGRRHVLLHPRRHVRVFASAPVSRTVLIKRHRRPGVLISGETQRTRISRHPATDLNVRANVRSRQTTGSSASSGRTATGSSSTRTTTGSSSTRSTTGSSSSQGSQSGARQPASNGARSGGQGGAQGASQKSNQPGQGSSQ